MSRLALISGPYVSGFALIAALALSPVDFNRPEVHNDILEHYKYGSIGAEGRAGIPYWIWLVLPQVFPEHLPDRAGNGYERFGFIFEPGKTRPIGTSYRERKGLPLVGLNCAVCHTGTIRDTPRGPQRIVPGMPSHQFDLQSYQQFLFKCIRDPRFTSATLWPALRKANPQFSWLQGIKYRWFIIPRTKREGTQVADSFSWANDRPRIGPGRVDTFNPYKVMFGFDMAADHTVGTADLPSLWNQKLREGMWLHWDGNNNLVTERNKSAAIGAGATEDSLDLPAMKRIEDWIWTMPAPRFPKDHIDAQRSVAGEKIYRTACANCHDAGGAHTGTTIPLTDIGTDPERTNSFTAALADKMNTIGANRPWKFSHFRKVDGYAAMPLDGVWARAPYLHNGSVPTLRYLLEKPENRPAVFWRGYDLYDYNDVGFVSAGPEAERLGFRYDTAVKGNGRAGHLYGTELSPDEKKALVEYLKTL